MINIFNSNNRDHIYNTIVNNPIQLIRSTIHKTYEMGANLFQTSSQSTPPQQRPLAPPSPQLLKNLFLECQKGICHIETQLHASAEPPLSELKEKTNKEFEKISQVLSNYSSLKFIHENRLGCTLDQETFSKIIQDHLTHPNQSIFNDYLRHAGKNLSFYKRMKARIWHTLSAPLIQRHTHEFLNNIFTHLRSNFIEKNPNDQLVQFIDKFILHFSKFFEIYNRIENELKAGKFPKAEFSKKLEEAISADLLDKNMEDLCKGLSNQIQSFIPKIKLFEELKQIPIIGYFYKALDWLFGNAIDRFGRKFIDRALDKNIQISIQSAIDNHQTLSTKITDFIAERLVMPYEYDPNILNQYENSPLLPNINYLLEKAIPIVQTKLKKWHVSSLSVLFLNKFSNDDILTGLNYMKVPEKIIYTIQESLKENISNPKCEHLLASTFENLSKKISSPSRPNSESTRNEEILETKQKLYNNWNPGLKLLLLDYSELEKTPEEKIQLLALQHAATKSYINKLNDLIASENRPNDPISAYVKILNELLLQTKTQVETFPTMVQNAFYQSYSPIIQNLLKIEEMLSIYCFPRNDPLQVNSDSVINYLIPLTREMNEYANHLMPTMNRDESDLLDKAKVYTFTKIASLGEPLVNDVYDIIHSKEIYSAIARISLRNLNDG